GAKLHRHAGDDVVRLVAGLVLAATATIGPPVAIRERISPAVVEGHVCRRQVAIVEVEGNCRGEFVANASDRLITELPAAPLQESAAEGLRYRNKTYRRLRYPRREGGERRVVERHAVDDVDRSDTGTDVGADRPTYGKVI